MAVRLHTILIDTTVMTMTVILRLDLGPYLCPLFCLILALKIKNVGEKFVLMISKSYRVRDNSV